MFEFTISEAYHDKLEPIEATGSRTDAEIFVTFQDYKPVTSEKNVRAYWHTALPKCPNGAKRTP
jgi:hypothetical protein